jgi:hypothetical protein
VPMRWRHLFALAWKASARFLQRSSSHANTMFSATRGEALALELVQADVDVTAVRWLGALHRFLVTEDLLRGPAAQRCLDCVAQHCRRLNGAGRELA